MTPHHLVMKNLPLLSINLIAMLQFFPSFLPSTLKFENNSKRNIKLKRHYMWNNNLALYANSHTRHLIYTPTLSS